MILWHTYQQYFLWWQEQTFSQVGKWSVHSHQFRDTILKNHGWKSIFNTEIQLKEIFWKEKLLQEKIFTVSDNEGLH